MDEALQKAVDIIVKVADPDKIILFGSRSRGNNRDDSDYDLCVLKHDVEHRQKLAQEIYRSLYGIRIPIDIIVETQNNLDEQRSDPSLVYKQIFQDGVTIYEKKIQL